MSSLYFDEGIRSSYFRFLLNSFSANGKGFSSSPFLSSSSTSLYSSPFTNINSPSNSTSSLPSNLQYLSTNASEEFLYEYIIIGFHFIILCLFLYYNNFSFFINYAKKNSYLDYDRNNLTSTSNILNQSTKKKLFLMNFFFIFSFSFTFLYYFLLNNFNIENYLIFIMLFLLISLISIVFGFLSILFSSYFNLILPLLYFVFIFLYYLIKIKLYNDIKLIHYTDYLSVLLFFDIKLINNFYKNFLLYYSDKIFYYFIQFGTLSSSTPSVPSTPTVSSISTSSISTSFNTLISLTSSIVSSFSSSLSSSLFSSLPKLSSSINPPYLPSSTYTVLIQNNLEEYSSSYNLFLLFFSFFLIIKIIYILLTKYFYYKNENFFNFFSSSASSSRSQSSHSSSAISKFLYYNFLLLKKLFKNKKIFYFFLSLRNSLILSYQILILLDLIFQYNLNFFIKNFCFSLNLNSSSSSSSSSLNIFWVQLNNIKLSLNTKNFTEDLDEIVSNNTPDKINELYNTVNIIQIEKILYIYLGLTFIFFIVMNYPYLFIFKKLIYNCFNRNDRRTSSYEEITNELNQERYLNQRENNIRNRGNNLDEESEDSENENDINLILLNNKNNNEEKLLRKLHKKKSSTSSASYFSKTYTYPNNTETHNYINYDNLPPEFLSIYSKKIIKKFQTIQKIHGFQVDNSRNQCEHLLLLLYNEIKENEMTSLDALIRIHKRLFHNYSLWCNHLNIQPNFLSNNKFLVVLKRKLFSNIKYHEENDEDSTVSSSIISSYQLNEHDEFKYDNLIEDIIIFFLIWGESANLRHMPECLCFIFHKIMEVHYFRSVFWLFYDETTEINEKNRQFILLFNKKLNHLSSTSSTYSSTASSFSKINFDNFYNIKDYFIRYPGFYLDMVVTPIYDILLKKTISNNDHEKRLNYDDFNEFFWNERSLKYFIYDTTGIPNYLQENQIIKIFFSTISEIYSIPSNNISFLSETSQTSPSSSLTEDSPLLNSIRSDEMKLQFTISEALSVTDKTYREKRSWLHPLYSLHRLFEWHCLTFSILTIMLFKEYLQWTNNYFYKVLSIIFWEISVFRLIWICLEIWILQFPPVSGFPIGAVIGYAIRLISGIIILLYQTIYFHWAFEADRIKDCQLNNNYLNYLTSNSININELCSNITPLQHNEVFNKGDGNFWWSQYIWLSVFASFFYLTSALICWLPTFNYNLIGWKNDIIQAILSVCSPLTQLFRVGNPIPPPQKETYGYIFFWVTLLSFKFYFAYLFIIQPAIGPTVYLFDTYMNYGAPGFLHTCTLLILWWLPHFLVYIIDLSIWYTVWASIAGGIVALSLRLGAVRDTKTLRDHFMRAPKLFSDRFFSSIYSNNLMNNISNINSIASYGTPITQTSTSGGLKSHLSTIALNEVVLEPIRTPKYLGSISKDENFSNYDKISPFSPNPNNTNNNTFDFASSSSRASNMNEKLSPSNMQNNLYNKLGDVNKRSQEWLIFAKIWNEVVRKLRLHDLISNSESFMLLFTQFSWLSKPVYLPLYLTGGCIDTITSEFSKYQHEFNEVDSKKVELKVKIWENFLSSVGYASLEAVSEAWELSNWLILEIISGSNDSSSENLYSDWVHLFTTIHAWSSSTEIFSLLPASILTTTVKGMKNIANLLSNDLQKRKKNPIPIAKSSASKAFYQNKESSSSNKLSKNLSSGFLSSLDNENDSSNRKLPSSKSTNQLKPMQEFSKDIEVVDQLRDKIREELKQILINFRNSLTNLLSSLQQKHEKIELEYQQKLFQQQFLDKKNINTSNHANISSHTAYTSYHSLPTHLLENNIINNYNSDPSIATSQSQINNLTSTISLINKLLVTCPFFIQDSFSSLALNNLANKIPNSYSSVPFPDLHRPGYISTFESSLSKTNDCNPLLVINKLKGLLSLRLTHCDLSSIEANRRLNFLINSLYMTLPQLPPLRHCREYSIITPYYSEDIILTEKDLTSTPNNSSISTGNNISVLLYLQTLYPNDWKNFLERLNNPDIDSEYNLDNFTNSSKNITPNSSKSFDSPERSMALRLWASLRAQTLFRTVEGMMFGEEAVLLLSELEQWVKKNESELQLSENINHDFASNYSVLSSDISSSPAFHSKFLSTVKFQYVVACQVYGAFKRGQDSRADDIDYLLCRYPSLRVAYIDTHRITSPQTPGKSEVAHYSVLVKSELKNKDLKTFPIPSKSTTIIKEVYRIKLPGNPILGEGKPENQNHAIIFTRGRFLQAIDMNQEGYFEEALKIRHLLEEFNTSPSDESTYSDLPSYNTSLTTSQPFNIFRENNSQQTSIIGFREHIFTGSVSSIANYMALQEISFVTLGQRVLTKPLNIRQHYGHPDFFDKFFIMTEGGMSKAGRGIHLSEDIFSGYNSTLRGYGVKFVEYLQVGKGRDVGLQQTYKFEAKLSQGNAEQSLSRDLARLGHGLDFFRLFSFYYGGIGHYLSNALIIVTLWVVVYSVLFLAMFNQETVGSITGKIVPLGLFQILLAGMGTLQTLPLIVTLTVEKGFLSMLSEISFMLISGGPLYFIFHIETKFFYFSQTLLAGNAKYRPTGRGFVTRHTPFDESFRFFANSHIYFGFELMVSLILFFYYTQSSQYFGMTWSLWLTAISFTFGAFWFNPLSFEWTNLTDDYLSYLKWMEEEGGDVEQSWKTWFKEENNFYNKLNFSSKIILLLKKSLIYLLLSVGVIYNQFKYKYLMINLKFFTVFFIILIIKKKILKKLSSFLLYSTRRYINLFLNLIIIILFIHFFIIKMSFIKSIFFLISFYYLLSSFSICSLLFFNGLNSSFFLALFKYHDYFVCHIIFLFLFTASLLQVGYLQTWLLYHNALSRGVEIEDILKYARKHKESGQKESNLVSELQQQIINQEKKIQELIALKKNFSIPPTSSSSSASSSLPPTIPPSSLSSSNLSQSSSSLQSQYPNQPSMPFYPSPPQISPQISGSQLHPSYQMYPPQVHPQNSANFSYSSYPQYYYQNYPSSSSMNPSMLTSVSSTSPSPSFSPSTSFSNHPGLPTHNIVSYTSPIEFNASSPFNPSMYPPPSPFPLSNTSSSVNIQEENNQNTSTTTTTNSNNNYNNNN